MNYHGKKFRAITNSSNGEITEDTIFEYFQSGRILTCEYSGRNIMKGHLLGYVDDFGNIDMRYHQIDPAGKIKTGVCFSKPEIMEDGKIRLHEDWKWTCGDHSSGQSVLEEI